jgi:acyl-phosphate glycerol 3-phosphate acyltransferase
VNGASGASVLAVSALAVLAAYLIGSIPFGYLVTYWVKGIDIRTVGSGNLGATNVGRTLGFRYFVLVFLLDMLKGLVPTLTFPVAVNRLTAAHPPDLPVLVGLAAILGHTFPVYLKFRGGKGVATSVGAVAALDPISCAVSVVAFGGFLGLTRYVSLASLLGGLAFAISHFARQSSPSSREHIAMTLFSLAVLGLLLVRHRGNLARIWAGTERKVNFGGGNRDSRPPREPIAPDKRSGKVVVWVVVGLALVSIATVAAISFIRHASETIMVTAGPWTLREIDRVSTGQQRVDRVAFAANGARLAATCPRYDRIVIYRVETEGKITQVREIQLEGRPVGLATLGDRFIVLETPTGDQRHVEPGWWETFDVDGNRKGGRNLAGYYADDLAITPDGKHLLLLSSGQAEGDAKKPLPALDIVAVDFKTESSHPVGRLTFDAKDDPCRLSVSAAGRCAAVLLTKTNQTLAIDLEDLANPRVIGRIKPTGSDAPYVSYSEHSDWIMMPVASQSEGIAIEAPVIGLKPAAEIDSVPPHHVDYLVCTRHHDSVLELFGTEPRQSLGRLPLTGPLNLGRTRPTGLAYSRERALLAVATRSGTIHMVAMVPRVRSTEPYRSPVISSAKNGTQR